MGMTNISGRNGRKGLASLATVAMAIGVGGLFTPGGKARAATLVDISIPNQNSPTGAGATGASTDKWNILDFQHAGTKTGLTDVTGTSTGLGFTLTGASFGIGAYGPQGTVPNKSMYNSYLYPSPTSSTKSATSSYQEQITGLTAGGSYNLYLYLYNKSGSFHVIGGTTPADQTITNAVGSSTWVSGSNYVEFAGITADASGNITIQPYGSSANGGEVDLNVLQIATAAAVPEPATVGLLALGGLGILSRKRRKA